MVSQKALVGNELMKEIISIRVDTLWKMLVQQKEGTLPGVDEEGATGKLDNKGAIFIPGGLIYQDVDEMHISYKKRGAMSGHAFRKKVREAMRYDNATLLFPDGIAKGINLDGGFFSKAAKRIYTFKKAAYRRKMKIGSCHHLKVTAEDIIHSHCPTYMNPPHGARTRISTCAAVGLVDPPFFFSYCESEFNLSREEAEGFAQRLDANQEAAKSAKGDNLYPPYVVVCHDTRYKENSLTGLTRILGIGKFGEFATLTFEAVNQTLAGELKRKRQPFTREDVFATFEGVDILCLLRIYAPTNPGKRSQHYTLQVVSPKRYLDLDLDQLKREARKRYPFSAHEPVQNSAQNSAQNSV